MRPALEPRALPSHLWRGPLLPVQGSWSAPFVLLQFLGNFLDRRGLALQTGRSEGRPHPQEVPAPPSKPGPVGPLQACQFLGAAGQPATGPLPPSCPTGIPPTPRTCEGLDLTRSRSAGQGKRPAAAHLRPLADPLGHAAVSVLAQL